MQSTPSKNNGLKTTDVGANDLSLQKQTTMICEEIIKTQSVPSCVGMLTIGTITVLNQLVDVIFENTATGRMDKLSATSSSSGVVIVDLHEYSLLPLSTYNVKIKKAEAVQDITIDTFTGKSVVFSVDIVNGATIEDYELTP